MSSVRTALVTGASGLVGYAVVQRMVADGIDVVAVTEPGGSSAVSAARTVMLDLAREAWPSASWDTIVHCAARIPARFDGPEAEAANAENRLIDDQALNAAAASGAHLVFLSSASVYGNTLGDIDDDTPPAPVLGYAREKLATEEAIAARSLPATVFRLVAPYGPRQKRVTVLLRFLDLALTGATLRYYGSGTRTQDFLHVDDVAAAVGLAAQRRVEGTFVLASGVATTMRELAELVVRQTGSTSRIEAAGIPDAEEGRNVRYHVERLEEQLGFRCSRSLAEGIADWGRVRRAELAEGTP